MSQLAMLRWFASTAKNATLRHGCGTAATRLRRDLVSTCRPYQFSGSIRLGDHAAALLFDGGSESLTDDLIRRRLIASFCHGNGDDPERPVAHELNNDLERS
jgi:hypothetical protein